MPSVPFSYRKVSRYTPVEASISTEKSEVPVDSPHTTRQAGLGCLGVLSNRIVIGLPGVFLSYAAVLLWGSSIAFLWAASESFFMAAMRIGECSPLGPPFQASSGPAKAPLRRLPSASTMEKV